MHRAKKCVFITTSNFCKEAKEYDGRIAVLVACKVKCYGWHKKQNRIVLLDDEQLTELMLTYNLGVST